MNSRIHKKVMQYGFVSSHCMAQHIQISLMWLKMQIKPIYLKHSTVGQVTWSPRICYQLLFWNIARWLVYILIVLAAKWLKRPKTKQLSTAAQEESAFLLPSNSFILIFCNVWFPDSKNVYKTRLFCSFYSPKQIGKKKP